MTVEQAEDRTQVLPYHVYIIPPNATLTIKDGMLNVEPPDEPRGHRTPIDSLFRSLAEDYGENAVCIMLSGTGTDGTLGLTAVKEHGGMAMAQTLDTAKIFTALPDGSMNYLNAQWTEFAGRPVDQMLGWSWGKFVYPADLPETIRTWKIAVDSGEPWEFVHRFRRFDGTYRWHLSRAHAMRNAARETSLWLGSSTDIHEEKGSKRNCAG